MFGCAAYIKIKAYAQELNLFKKIVFMYGNLNYSWISTSYTARVYLFSLYNLA